MICKRCGKYITESFNGKESPVCVKCCVALSNLNEGVTKDAVPFYVIANNLAEAKIPFTLLLGKSAAGMSLKKPVNFMESCFDDVRDLLNAPAEVIHEELNGSEAVVRLQRESVSNNVWEKLSSLIEKIETAAACDSSIDWDSLNSSLNKLAETYINKITDGADNSLVESAVNDARTLVQEFCGSAHNVSEEMIENVCKILTDAISMAMQVYPDITVYENRNFFKGLNESAFDEQEEMDIGDCNVALNMLYKKYAEMYANEIKEADEASVMQMIKKQAKTAVSKVLRNSYLDQEKFKYVNDCFLAKLDSIAQGCSDAIDFFKADSSSCTDNSVTASRDGGWKVTWEDADGRLHWSYIIAANEEKAKSYIEYMFRAQQARAIKARLMPDAEYERELNKGNVSTVEESKRVNEAVHINIIRRVNSMKHIKESNMQTPSHDSKTGIAVFYRKPAALEDVVNLARKYRPTDAYFIERTISISDDEWLEWARDLYASKSFLADNQDAMFAKGDKTILWHVLRVTCSSEPQGILVDCEGYDYARYVALPEDSGYLSDMKKAFPKSKYNKYSEALNTRKKYKHKVVEAMSDESIYVKNGYANRNEYLASLADEYNVSLDVVQAAAEVLGPSEDFDGLVSELSDMYDCSDIDYDSDETNYDPYAGEDMFDDAFDMFENKENNKRSLKEELKPRSHYIKYLNTWFDEGDFDDEVYSILDDCGIDKPADTGFVEDDFCRLTDEELAIMFYDVMGILASRDEIDEAVEHSRK